AVAQAIGPASVEALRQVFVDGPEAAREPIAGIIVALGAGGVPRLAPLVSAAQPHARRFAARMLGRIGSADGVPLLLPLLRGQDPDVAREAVRALSVIDDPSAARAVRTVLRAAQGRVRDAIVAALVSERDARVVPVLMSVLDTSEPAGEDFDVVVDTLKALGILADSRAVPAIDRMIRKKGWRGRKRLRLTKAAGLQTLAAMDSDVARRAIADAATTGDRALKKLAREMAGGARG
ncbi:MAG: HEAT repeat domain-containing protein, partial [Acidobacteriota bacterium]|nr:HEAT repeat domain-containing protein [Acidobacteriota bacterium]